MSRIDLSEARECVSWVVSQFPSLRQRLESWMEANIHVAIKEENPAASHNPIIAIEKEPLPLSFSVEVGAYVNILRTSPDILAISLARRHGMTKIDNVYFPVVASRSKFLAGDHKGAKFVKRLPGDERSLIENLKPYKGGNDRLWALHALDIKRKHHALLTVQAHPKGLSITGHGADRHFAPLGGAGGWIPGHDGAVLGLFRKGAPEPKFQYTPLVGFDEAETGMSHVVLDALDEFASLANTIITLFDR